ncbi:MAG: DUF4340 domain-containing protein [Thermogutta sp.]
MNEIKKTVAFVAVAAVVLLVAWWVRYVPRVTTTSDTRGKPLFPAFTDALAATSLEIFEYDANSVKIKNFKVAQINNRWSIPSHENYPADAKDHLARAATSLIGLTVLDVASESPSQEEIALFGVVEPDENAIKTSTRGIGKRVIFRDIDDKVLADLIIGNKVPDKEELRYVRIKGQDPIYVVKLSEDKFSSEFGDWIEKDLLKLNPWDIKDIQIHDYSFDSLTGTLAPRSQIVLNYDDLGSPRWKLAQNLVFDGDQGTWKPQSLADDEELDTSKLDSMRTALDDLKIVDVRRKPEGISQSLSADGSLMANRETAASLSQAGFFLASARQFYSIFPMIGKKEIKPNDVEVISSEGEVRVGMKDGVRYLLRFGQVVAGESSSQAGESGGAGVNRYLFVMAEFDPELIPKPELQPLPELPPNGQTPAASTSTAVGQSTTMEEVQTETTVSQGPSPTDQGSSGDESSAEAAEKKKEEGEAKEAGQAKKPEDIKAERERIEKENKRKQDEYEEKLKKGQDRVKELNARFADWYYIISDEVYRKIHLSLSDIVKKKQKNTEKTEQGESTSPATKEEKGGSESAANGEKPAESEHASPETKPADGMPMTPQTPPPAESPGESPLSAGQNESPAQPAEGQSASQAAPQP